MRVFSIVLKCYESKVEHTIWASTTITYNVLFPDADNALEYKFGSTLGS